MTRFPLSGSSRQCRLLLVGFLALSACTDRTPAGPSPSGAALARPTGGNGPTVKAAVPDSATVDTTLNVRVLGSGFDQGSRANWALKGVPSAKVVTNSTQFVSSTELVANITIARDANVGSYDVIVTTSSGKGGIGTELFAITLKAIDLGTLGGTYARAYAINSSGQIVGVSKPAVGSERATYWEKVSPTTWSIRQLGSTPGETQSGAAGINDAGVIAGWTYGPGSDGLTQGDPVRWLSQASAPQNLGSQGWEAGGINLAGQILGAMNVDGFTRGFLWENGVITDLGHLGGGQSQAFDINSSGDAVGYSRLIPFPTGRTRAVVWKAGVITQLPMLPGGTSDAMARNINDAGVIVGQSPNAAGESRAVRWVPSAGEASGYRIEDLGVGRGVASGINSYGEIVGEYYTRSSWRAFYWHPVRGKTDLPPLRTGANAQAHAINDAREVVGSGENRTSGSDLRAIVWIGIQ
jgi:probable HAF family extracellular repeat protein